MGPINVSITGVADDLHLMKDTKSKLQALFKIAEHYGNRYRIKYGAAKTKITVDGSLGLLALGDLGFRAWREIKNKADKKNMIDEEE